MTASLSPEDYQTLVAPVLEVCANLAASRGDPTLYNDLPSMVALVQLTKGLASLHYTARAPLGQAPEAAIYTDLPLAVAVMVLAEHGIEPPLLDQMAGALLVIAQRLDESDLLPPPAVLVSPAWAAMLGGQVAQIHLTLRQAGSQVIAAVQTLESGRGQ